MTHSRSAIGPGLARFLGQEGVVREGGTDDLEDGLLAEVVDLGDDILLALVDDGLEPLVALHLDAAGLQGGLGRDLQLAGEVVAGHTLMLAGQAALRPADRQAAGAER